MEKEIQEAAENYFLQEYSWNGKNSLPYKDEDVKLTKENFISGAKWQAERMYSEDEVMYIIDSYSKWKYHEKEDEFYIDVWFEQFKKK